MGTPPPLVQYKYNTTLHIFSLSLSLSSALCKMSATHKPDIEAAGGTDSRRHNRRLRRYPIGCGSETTDGGSLGFSDSDDDDQSWHSTLGGSPGFVGLRRPEEEESCSEEGEVDLESGGLEGKVHFDFGGGKDDMKDCRICHLTLVGDGGGGGGAMELGCDCKGDLGAAHKQCAETWFKIRGNTTCEICGTTAFNVAGEHTNEAIDIAAAAASTTQSAGFSEHRSFWQGRHVMNFLLGCMVLAFVISWLFHFKVLHE